MSSLLWGVLIAAYLWQGNDLISLGDGRFTNASPAIFAFVVFLHIIFCSFYYGSLIFFFARGFQGKFLFQKLFGIAPLLAISPIILNLFLAFMGWNDNFGVIVMIIISFFVVLLSLPTALLPIGRFDIQLSGALRKIARTELILAILTIFVP